jgi:hypothetical protein
MQISKQGSRVSSADMLRTIQSGAGFKHRLLRLRRVHIGGDATN